MNRSTVAEKRSRASRPLSVSTSHTPGDVSRAPTVLGRNRDLHHHEEAVPVLLSRWVAWGPAFVPCPCPHTTPGERQRTRRTPQHGGESARARQHHARGTIGSDAGAGWLAARASGLPGERPASGCRAAIRPGRAMPARSHPARCSAHPPASTLHHPFSQRRRFFRWLRASHAADRPTRAAPRWTCPAQRAARSPRARAAGSLPRCSIGER